MPKRRQMEKCNDTEMPVLVATMAKQSGDDMRGDHTCGYARIRRTLEARLRERPSRERLVKRFILRRAGVALQCSLAVKKHSTSWDWMNAKPCISPVWTQQDCDAPTSEVMADAQIWQIANGIRFSMYATVDGQLFCAGAAQCIPYERAHLRSHKRNRAHASRQQLKTLASRESELYGKSHHVSHEMRSTPVPMLLPASFRVRQVSCGISHCIALAQNESMKHPGTVLFAWGQGHYGQLGLAEQQVANVMTPIDTSPLLQQLLSANASPQRPSAVELRCGPFSTYVFLPGASTVLHWGLLPSGDSTEKFVFQGVPVEFPMLDEDVKVADLAVGLEHLVLLSSSGKVFTWGYGSSGQLGQGHEVAQNVREHAQQVDFFHREVSISAIACGWNHTIALTSDKNVFAWGTNRLGACGATTKFHEYFHPVRVPIPHKSTHSFGPAADNDLDYSISCCGNTSVLMARSSDGALAATYMWGMCSSTVASLAPIEIPDIRHHRHKFVACKAGFGALHCIYTTESVCTTDERAHQLWQIQAPSLPRQLCSESGGVASHFDVQVGDAITVEVRVMGVPKFAAEAYYSPERIGVREKPVSACSHKNVELLACKSDKMAITLKAVSTGCSLVYLSHGNDLIFGSPIEVHIREADDPLSLQIQDCCFPLIRINGVCVLDDSLHPEKQPQPLGLADLQWRSPIVKRIRMNEDDTLLILLDIETGNHATEPAIHVRTRFNQATSASITVTRCMRSGANGGMLALANVRFPAPGEYCVFANGSDPHTCSTDKQQQLVTEAVCIMSSRARRNVFHANKAFIKRHYTPAASPSCADRTNTPSPSMRAMYSTFISRVLQNERLRDALANTPLTATCDMEGEACWDFDRECVDRELLCRNSTDPFVLWRSVMVSLDDLRQHVSNALPLEAPAIGDDEAVPARSFWEVLPQWAIGDPAFVSFSLTSVGVPCDRSQYISPHASDEAAQMEVDQARRHASDVVGLAVHQSPCEFLVDGNTQTQQIAIGSRAGDEVASAWRDHHGDLYYTIQPPADGTFRIRVYGHESHHFRETAEGSLMGKRKAQTHAFLWTVLNAQQCSIETLFQCFLRSPPSNPDDEVQHTREARRNAAAHIRLPDFVDTLQALGFPSSSISKQEWLALFQELQTLAATTSAKVTLSVFRTFLVDPFHELFWRHYASKLQSFASNAHSSSLETVLQTFVDHFRPLPADLHRLQQHTQREDDHEASCLLLLPWSEFLERLHRFHAALGRESATELLSATDCCRLLYRFDVRCNGWIAAHLFQRHVIASLRDQIIKADGTKATNSGTAEKKQSIAVMTSTKRPNVDEFSTPNAVQKLFLARAKQQQQKNQQRRHSHSTKSTKDNASHSSFAATKLATLLQSGNTHLARIRSLPVTKLLREGVHFRPQQYRDHTCMGEDDDDTAVEQSY